MADEEQNGTETAAGAVAAAMVERRMQILGRAKKENVRPGVPKWMVTFSDMVTLLLTFFVLLLSFAKMETQKYEAALGSIRNAFGGNVLEKGEIIQPGKSPDDSPTMIDARELPRPFPIEFLSTDGFLDKYEINRESDEVLQKMRHELEEYSLSDSVDIYQIPEGIKVRIKDKIHFKKGSVALESITISVFERLVQMLSSEHWTIFVEGHADPSEGDAFDLSAQRANAVARSLIKRGVRPDKITVVSYGNTRPSKEKRVDLHRRVEFLLRKVDLRTEGHKVDPR